jgi:hypothetical protein
MLPSASLGEADAKTKKRKALYEPCMARRRTSPVKASPIQSL